LLGTEVEVAAPSRRRLGGQLRRKRGVAEVEVAPEKEGERVRRGAKRLKER
jgi:hypothetical protein